MKLLFVTGQKCLPQVCGGTQISTDHLCRSLLERGHGVAVLCGFIHGGFCAWLCKIQRRILGRTVSRDTLLGYPVWRSWRPWDEVDYVVGKERPDLIIVVSGDTVAMALAGKRTGIPILLDFHDVNFDHHAAPFETLGTTVPCIANSHFTADRYRSVYGVNPAVIAPFIVAEKYRTKTSGENVTFVNPVRIKGRNVALEIARQCPDIPFVFVKAWPLSLEEHRDLEHQLSALPNVTLLTTHKDMRTIYAKSKILLAPSICEETYGRVVAEAQISGIPVVASNRGGLPEAVGPGGILLDPEDSVERWVAAIRKLWDDNDYYAQVSAAALAHASRIAISFEYQILAWERAMLAASQPWATIINRDILKSTN